MCECKNAIKHCNCKKNYNWNLRTYICKNGKYLKSIFDDSVITSDGIMNELCSESTKTMIINLNNKKATCKMDNCYIYIFCININCHIAVDNCWCLLLLSLFITLM